MAKKQSGRPSGRTGKATNLYLPHDVSEALDKYLESSQPRTSRSAVAVMLFRDFLEKEGYLKKGKK